MLTENESNVKPHLPESNPGETSDFVKNNARFAAHAEQTIDSIVSGFEVETLPEFLKDAGVEVSDNVEDQLDEYGWHPGGRGSQEVGRIYVCNDCDGEGTVVDQDEKDEEVMVCSDCLGTGYVDQDGEPVRIGFGSVEDGSREDEVVTDRAEELEVEDIMQENLGKDGKKPAVPYSKSTQADLDRRIAKASPPRKDNRDHNDADEGEVARHLRHMRQLSGLESTHDDVDEAIDAPKRVIKDKELTAYLDRTIEKEKKKTDKFKLPYIHRSNIVKKYQKDDNIISSDKQVPIVDTEERKYDLEKLAADITQRPTQLLKQNEKMQHSDGTTSIFYNIGLPALTGLGYDEAKKEFVVINTCPGAGECKTFCYALKGGYVQWPSSSTSQTRILNFLYNDPSGFFEKLNAEIDEQKRKGDAKQDKHKVVVRWHDAGDFFSDEYLDLAYKLAAMHPTVDFYAYTKRADVSGSTQNRPPNWTISQSMGARKAEEKRVDFGLTKHSVVVPPILFQDLLLKDGNKLVKGPGNGWQWKDEQSFETFKTRMMGKYKSIKPGTLITYDEMMKIPYGGGGAGSGVADGDRSFKRGIYNVIVKPGDGDDSANRADVLGTYLLMH